MRKLLIDSTEIYTSHKRRSAWKETVLAIVAIGVLWPAFLWFVLALANIARG